MATVAVGWPAQAYARSFGVLCAGTVPAVADVLGTGALALDVGCGPGSLAAALTGRFERVLGLDPEPAMLELASGVAGVEVVRGGLPALPLATGSADATGANFVVNHSPDPRGAVVELARVTRPGGRVAATVWPSSGASVNTLWDAVLARAGVDTPMSTPLPAPLDFDRTVDGFGDLFTAAGLGAVASRQLDWQLEVDVEDLWTAATEGVASIGACYAALEDRGRDRLRDAYQLETAARTVGGRYRQPVTALLAHGVVTG